ncbi:MAG: EFR1 family ferrodoxin [Anaerovoracaceae bacterium]
MAKKVIGAYFSATGTTKTVVETIMKELALVLDLPWETWDFTLPKARTEIKEFNKEDIVIFGTPVIAGRVPNVLLKFLDTLVGNGAICVPIVCFGNRSYDNALIELRDILEKSKMTAIAAGGFSCLHSFSQILGQGRPDDNDKKQAREFAKAIGEKISSSSLYQTIEVDGLEGPSYGGYYQPRDRKGNPVDIRKVKPVTDLEKCTNCKVCVNVCPLGSIDVEDVSKLNGICMKCCACIKKCPEGAKSFVDENYLYHQHELEAEYIRPAKNSIFV